MNLKKLFFNFLIFIPILFALAYNTTGYFSPRGLNPGTIRGFFMLFYLAIFLFKFYPESLVNKIIFLFVFYIGILSFLSSDINLSLYGYMKFFIASLMFPLGYYFINNHEKLLLLTRSYAWALGIFMLNIAVSNLFGLGSSDYLEESFYFGAGRVNITKVMIILIFTGPILLYSHKFKYSKVFGIFLAVSSFITMIGIKRSVLLSAIAGVLIFGLTSKSKTLFLRGIIGLSIILISFVFIFPKTIEIFYDRYEARSEELEINEEVFDKEGRVNETYLVIDTWVKGTIAFKFFGGEIFNDRYLFKKSRMLHTDYMVVLAGSGLVGIIFWFLIYYLMVREKEKYWKFLKLDPRFSQYHPVFYSILAAQMLMSISGTIQGIDLRSFILLYLGALIGSMRGEVKNLLQKSESGTSPEMLKEELKV